MKKRLVINTIFIMITFVYVMGFAAFASEKYEDEANTLKTLGLFLGSEKGFELDRVPNRAEAAVMLIRLLGKENEVKLGIFEHPFTDVPKWADSYVGYMYEQGLTKGIGNKMYGSAETMDAKSYATFVLRVLGYSDKSGDFSWSSAITKCRDIGVLSESESLQLIGSSQFLRGDMVHLSYTALQQTMNGTTKTLSQGLIDDKVFTNEMAISLGLIDGQSAQKTNSDGSATVNIILRNLAGGGFPQQNIILDRSKLPDSMKNFSSILSAGVSKPKDEITRYMIMKQAIENAITNNASDRLSRAETNYNDTLGISFTKYEDTLLTFYDQNKQLVGFGTMYGAKAASAVLTVYPILNISDLKKPDNFDAVYNAYAALPQISSGYTILSIGGHGFLTLDPNTLPSKLRHAKFVGFGSTSFTAYDQSAIEHFIMDSEMYNNVSLDEKPVGLDTQLNNFSNAIITLFDTDKKLISVTIASSSSFITTDPHYGLFEGEVYNGTRITSSDFVVKRYINGVEDTTYNGLASYGVGYPGNESPGKFNFGPVFIADETVEYKFESLNKDLRNIVMKR